MRNKRMGPDDPRHGTPAGYSAERRLIAAGQLDRTCDRCRAANAAAMMAYRQAAADRKAKVVAFTPKRTAPTAGGRPTATPAAALATPPQAAADDTHTGAVEELQTLVEADYPDIWLGYRASIRIAHAVARTLDKKPTDDKLIRELRLLTEPVAKALIVAVKEKHKPRKPTVAELLGTTNNWKG